MTTRERFHKIMNFEKVDRLPALEWASYWDLTIERWKKEGLDINLKEHNDISDYFGLDKYRQLWVEPYRKSLPTVNHGQARMTDMNDYSELKKHLFPEEPFNKKTLEKWAIEQEKGNMVVWITLEGFFWFPRELFGIEEHFMAFMMYPDVMKRINEDILEYNKKVYQDICSFLIPDFMTFAEDMSYNRGSMISKDLFDEFMSPYYKDIIPDLKKKGTIPFVDTDGLVNDLIPWHLDVGIEGFLPLEKQAGVDINEIRKEYPKLKMIGGFDKMVMHLSEEDVRNEFKRILPVCKQGGYIPSVDHQTPPAVSMEQYKRYVRLLKEYCLL